MIAILQRIARLLRRWLVALAAWAKSNPIAVVLLGTGTGFIAYRILTSSANPVTDADAAIEIAEHLQKIDEAHTKAETAVKAAREIAPETEALKKEIRASQTRVIELTEDADPTTLQWMSDEEISNRFSSLGL